MASSVRVNLKAIHNVLFNYCAKISIHRVGHIVVSSVALEIISSKQSSSSACALRLGVHPLDFSGFISAGSNGYLAREQIKHDTLMGCTKSSLCIITSNTDARACNPNINNCRLN